jgi:capsid protein
MTLYHTYGPARAAINKQVEYAVGPGLVFRSQPDFSMLGMTQEQAKEWGKDFQKIVHYYMQKYSAYELQNVLMRGGLAGGDSLLFFIRDSNGLDDLVEFSGDQIAWEYSDDTTTLGIRHDQYMRRTGFKKLDGTMVDYKDGAGNQNVIQYFEKELPRQMRGYPLLYSIINLAKNDDRHTDATTQRAVMESIMLGWTETEGTDPIKQTSNMASANLKKFQRDNGTTSTLSKIANAFRLGAGNMYQFRKGEKMNFTDLKTPSDTFKDFKEVMLDYIGAATGTPSQMITSKYSTSYTSHKGTFNDFKKSYMKKRSTFERVVMRPIIREIAKDAIINGYISAPGFFDNPMTQSAYLQGMFLGPVPGAINPLQEVNADVKSVQNGFTLRSDVAARNGHEWDNMINEWTTEQQEWFAGSEEKQAADIMRQEQSSNQEDITE